LLAAFERERPNDINLWSCVGTKSDYELSIFEESAISTVNKDWEKRFLAENQKIAEVVKVPGISLKTIFGTYFNGAYPNLLCIDAEGSDLDVLKSAELSISQGPDWLLLEADPPLSNVLSTPAVAYALSLDYEIHQIMGLSTLLKKKS